MHFLTEDDIRSRNPEPGCTLTLAADERLTPSAAEYANSLRMTVVQAGAGACVPCAAVKSEGGVCADGVSCVDTVGDGMTHLDASTTVPKSHPRIALRGKLDTLLSTTVLVQTQFDPKNRLSPYLKDCLGDIANWVMQILAAEVSGSVLSIPGMGGMDVATLHAVSRDPKRYLGIDPFVPSSAMGGNAALCNWLRALVREAEVVAAQSGLNRADIAGALNRLSSAVYVLVLLTLAAENGVDVKNLGAGK